jgi:SPASM domain peptide maturase of grasp-with-spasm system
MYFILFANCIFVEGTQSAIIIDLQNGCYYPISNKFKKIYNLTRINTVKEIHTILNNSIQSEVIDGYFEKLIIAGIGFYCEEIDRFPALKKEWQSPHKMHEAIVEIDSYYKFDYINLFLKLIDYGVLNLVIIINCDFDLEFIKKIDDSISDSAVSIIDIYIESMYISDEIIQHLNKLSRRFSKFVIHNTKERTIYNLKKVNMVPNKIIFSHPKSIKNENFVINISTYMESIFWNTQINRRIYIDSLGNIKNNPFCIKYYGNIKIDYVIEIYNNESFREFWKVPKTKIEKCKDCEFRHICTYSSQIIKKQNKYYHEIDCDYEPE